MGGKSLGSCLLQVEILKVKKDLIYQKDHWTKILSSFMSCILQVWVYQFSCLTLGEDSVWVKMRVHLWENAELLCSVCSFPTLSSHIQVSSCPQHHVLSGNPFPAGLSWELDSSRSIYYSGLFLSTSLHQHLSIFLPEPCFLCSESCYKEGLSTKNITQNVEMLRLVIAGGEGGECGIQGGWVWVCVHA